jgi:hypothetical protein
MSLLNGKLLPFVCMLTLSIVIIVCIRKSRKRVQAATVSTVGNSNVSRKDRKFAITALLLNLLFFVTNFPIGIFSIVSTYVNIDSDSFLFLYVLTLTMVFVFYAFDSFVQFFTNSVFREEFFLLFDVKLTRIGGSETVASMSLSNQ